MRATCVLGLIAGTLLSVTPGCSLIGFGLGAAADSVPADTSSTTEWSDWNLQEHDSITVLLSSGVTLRGVFRGVSLLPDMTYEQRYAAGPVDPDISLPQLYDSIIVTNGPGIVRNMEG